MKKCLGIAVLLLMSTAAHAQYTFDYGGRTITIDPDRGTVSIPGVFDNTGKKAKSSRGEEGDTDRRTKKSPQQAKTAPQPAPETAAPAAPAPAEQATAPAAPAPVAPAPTAPATASRGETSTATVAPANVPAPPVPQSTATAVEPAPAPAAAPQPAPAPQKQAAAPATSAPSPANSPLGRMADRGKGRQGTDRTMRPQSVRLFRRQEVEPERRAGSDQHEARERQMERAGFSIRPAAAPMIPPSR